MRMNIECNETFVYGDLEVYHLNNDCVDFFITTNADLKWHSLNHITYKSLDVESLCWHDG